MANRQRGVALIIVLMLLAIMATIAATMSERLFCSFSAVQTKSITSKHIGTVLVLKPWLKWVSSRATKTAIPSTSANLGRLKNKCTHWTMVKLQDVFGISKRVLTSMC